MSVAARPALKTTISSIPSAIWSWLIAPSRTTSADGQGISPAAAPIASRPLRSCSVVVVVVMVVVTVLAFFSVPAQDARADADHEQAGEQVQPREQVLGQDVLATAPSVIEAEREDARGVGGGDDPAERDGVPRLPARADEVGGDHRLAVPGGERVHGAPAERGDEQEQQHAVAVVEDAGEAVDAVPPPMLRSAPGASSVPVPGRTSKVASRRSAGLLSRSSG